MILTCRLYLTFKEIYSKQSKVKLFDPQINAADMYSRETLVILGEAVNKISDNSEKSDDTSILGQRSGLKISILN